MAENSPLEECIKGSEIQWQDPDSDGIIEKYFTKGMPGTQLKKLKLDCGQMIPYHEHHDTRYTFVGKGRVSEIRKNSNETREYMEGDIFITRKGSAHSVQAGPFGCELLVIWDKEK